MKREVKNDKVLRAITIGLATMIAATSAPVNVWAADGDETTPAPEEDPVNETHEEVESVQVESNEGEKEAVEGAQETVDNLTSESEATPLIDAALAVTSDTETEAALNLAAAYIDGAEAGSVDGVDEKIVGVRSELNDLNNLINNPVQISFTVDGAGAQVDSNTTVDPFELDEGNVIPTDEDGIISFDENTGTPNFVDENNKPVLVDSNPVNVTVENAEGSAEVIQRDTTDPQLAGFIESYDNAIKAINNNDLPAAESFAREADAKVQAAQQKVDILRNAIQDSAAAQAAAEQAQKKADLLKEASDKYLNQYTKVLSEYYGAALSKLDKNSEDGKKIYPNGVLDIDAAAEYLSNHSEIAMNIAEGKNGYKNGSILPYARNLLEKIVTFNISQSDDYNNDIVFGVAGEITGKDYNKKQNQTDVDTGKTEQKIWAEYQGGDGGRNHRIKVTYTTGTGENKVEHTEYYNYYFKNPSNNYENSFKDNEEESNFKNGAIYVVKEVRGENNEKTFTTLGSLDDYDLLKEAADAKNAVDAAANEVRTLRSQILQIASIATSDIELEGEFLADSDLTLDQLQKILEAKLAKAQEALDNSKTNLDALNQLIGYLKEVKSEEETITEATDTDDDDSDDGSDDADVSVVVDPVGGVTFSSTSYGVTPIILPSTTAIFGGTGTAGGEGSGVLGVRTGNPADQISSSLDSKIVNKPVAKKMIANKTNNKGTKIEDPIVPLADTPFEDSTRLNWGWLLIIFLLGATGKKLYDEYKKKQEEANAAKSK